MYVCMYSFNDHLHSRSTSAESRISVKLKRIIIFKHPKKSFYSFYYKKCFGITIAWQRHIYFSLEIAQAKDMSVKCHFWCYLTWPWLRAYGLYDCLEKINYYIKTYGGITDRARYLTRGVPWKILRQLHEHTLISMENYTFAIFCVTISHIDNFVTKVLRWKCLNFPKQTARSLQTFLTSRR